MSFLTLAELDLEFLKNPYVLAALAGAAILVIWKIIDQRRDARQKVYQEIANAFTKLGQDEFAAAFEALARDGHEEFINRLVAVMERLKKPGGVAEVLCTIIIKSFSDDDFMEDKAVKARLQPVIAKRLLGFLLDDKVRQEFTLLGPELREYGSKEVAQFFSSVGANDLDSAKVAGQALVALLRDKDRIDDVLMDRAKKAIPKLLSMPEHAAALRALVAATPAT